MIYLTDAYRNIFEILKKSKQLTFQLPFFFLDEQQNTLPMLHGRQPTNIWKMLS